MKLGQQHSAMLFVAPTYWAATAQRPIARGVKALVRGTAGNLRSWLLACTRKTGHPGPNLNALRKEGQLPGTHVLRPECPPQRQQEMFWK